MLLAGGDSVQWSVFSSTSAMGPLHQSGQAMEQGEYIIHTETTIVLSQEATSTYMYMYMYM